MSESEICDRAAQAGTSLRVRKGRLYCPNPKALPEDLKVLIHTNRERLRAYLTFDQEEAMRLFREALSHLADQYVPGAECEEDGELSEKIDRAIEQRDMWAFRAARKEWVNAWLRAIGEAKVELSKERQGVA